MTGVFDWTSVSGIIACRISRLLHNYTPCGRVVGGRIDDRLQASLIYLYLYRCSAGRSFVRPGTVILAAGRSCAWSIFHLVARARVQRDITPRCHSIRAETVELIKLFMINRLRSAIDVRHSRAEWIATRRRAAGDATGPNATAPDPGPVAAPVVSIKRHDDRHFVDVVGRSLWRARCVPGHWRWRRFY